MDKFTLVLGQASSYLPGNTWTEYEVEVLQDKMICTCKKDNSTVVEISYSEFKEAEFGIGSGNLWLQCVLENGDLYFCSPRKSWKSKAAEKLINEINSACGIHGMKTYKRFTGPFGVFSTF